MTSFPRPVWLVAITMLGLSAAPVAAGNPPPNHRDIADSAGTDLLAPDLAAWRQPRGTWAMVGGVALDPASPEAFVAPPGRAILLNHPRGKTVNLLTRGEFGDCDVVVEFNVSRNSNSGVYLMGRYEVQIRDSFGKPNPDFGDCGGIYARHAAGKSYEGSPPRVNASRPAGEWQRMEISFRAPRFDAGGRKTENARFLRVVLNGQVVQEQVDVSGPTRSATYSDEARLGPLMLQGDHGPVAFRILRITPR